MNDRPLNTDPEFRVVGHVEGDFIVWNDGRPPTPLDQDMKPAVDEASAGNE